ncbi:MAG: hypothetical protein HXY20_05425 [Acidobacteria bacterium]|nr:hypothetical protein [Acidobacteriota bacterium]
MKTQLAVLLLICVSTAVAARTAASREYLTPEEITRIQEAQEIDQRTKLYLEYAALRLKVAEQRLWGKESLPGDPMEFFSVQDMLEGYYQILRSVMITLDDAYQKPHIERERVIKALKSLRESTRKALEDLEVLKKVAEEKKLEDVWNLTMQALDITRGACEGAELDLAGQPEDKSQKRKKKL